MYVFAFDVSMGHSYKVLYHDSVCLSEGTLLHDKAGFQRLSEEIRALPEVPEIVFEATGIYSRVLEKFCQDHGFTYFSLNPLEARRQTDENTLRRWKSDKTDAHRLALSHFEKKEVRHSKVPQEKNYQALRDLTRFYKEIDERFQQLRMCLHNALQLSFPELELFFSSRVTPYALTLIERFPHPTAVLKKSRTQIKNELINHTKKKISEKKAWEKADQILAYAQNAYPAVESDSIDCQKVVYYAQQMQELLAEKEAITKQLKNQASVLEEFESYISFPGIGELSAALLIGELGDIRRFQNANQLNAYVGIDIRHYQSGKYIGKDHINKRGNPKARKILYFVIRNMIRQQRAADNHIVDYYYKLKKQPIPKKDKVATVACMNKLLKCMFSMARKHTMYDYAYAASNDHYR